MTHIQLNYAFLLFWSIIGKIQRELLFLVKKWLSQKGAMKYSESFFFNMFVLDKSWVKLWFVYITVLDQTSNLGQKLTKTVFLPKVSHVQLNYTFLLFCSIYGEIHRELLFFVKKVGISERGTEKLRYLFS